MDRTSPALRVVSSVGTSFFSPMLRIRTDDGITFKFSDSSGVLYTRRYVTEIDLVEVHWCGQGVLARSEESKAAACAAMMHL